jgi:hypothetical protein
MEVVKPVKSILNGNLAYKEGDWNFSKPCHWYFSKRIMKPIQAEEYISPPRIYIRNLPNQETDKEWKFKPSLRMFPCMDKLPNWIPPETGKKAMLPKYTAPIVHPPHVNHSPHMFSPEKRRCVKQFPEKWTRQSLGDEDFFEELVRKKHGLAKNGINVMKSMEYKGNDSGPEEVRNSPRSNLIKSLDLQCNFDSEFLNIGDKGRPLKDNIRYVKDLDKWDDNNNIRLNK